MFRFTLLSEDEVTDTPQQRETAPVVFLHTSISHRAIWLELILKDSENHAA